MLTGINEVLIWGVDVKNTMTGVLNEIKLAERERALMMVHLTKYWALPIYQHVHFRRGRENMLFLEGRHFTKPPHPENTIIYDSSDSSVPSFPLHLAQITHPLCHPWKKRKRSRVGKSSLYYFFFGIIWVEWQIGIFHILKRTNKW